MRCNANRVFWPKVLYRENLGTRKLRASCPALSSFAQLESAILIVSKLGESCEGESGSKFM